MIGCRKSNNEQTSPETKVIAAKTTVKAVTDPLEEIASNYKVRVLPVSLPNGKSRAGNDTYSIKIDNLNLDTKKPYSPSFIASKAAVIIFRSFNEKEKKDIRIIDITVNSIFKTETITYKVHDLEKIDPYLKIARSAVGFYIAGNHKGFYSLTDPAYIPMPDDDSAFNDDRKKFSEAIEGVRKIEDDGFEFDTEEGLKVIRFYYTTLSSGKKKLEWEVIFLDNDDKPKIAGFHVIP
ncbi:hypothetical protein HYN59_00175 [Flavobacterium album]|uniref:Uncharacterized protein n=1 Tax=Flavobacterium album TaxID=2175091 RepID=A0A2S1QTA0_9FLAO|nr:hypothetical protein HYN59_00175 [Flavobacterium album]